MVEKNKKLSDTLKKVEEGINEVRNGDKYKTFLRTMAKFHSYSFNNLILIMLQRPDASLVAGFNKWKEMKRCVKKGEKGIVILAPCPTKYVVEEENEETGEMEKTEIKRTFFKPVHVFDVSQTEGEPIPDICDELEGSVDDYKAIVDGLVSISPVPVSFEDVSGGAKGYFSRDKKVVVVKKGMSEIQSIKTLAHEITHAILHGDKGEARSFSRSEKEIQAESVAFAVCDHFGIDTSDYSFEYLTSWSGDDDGLKAFKSSLSIIQKTANNFITQLESFLKCKKEVA